MENTTGTYLIDYKGLNFHTVNFPGKEVAKKFVHGGEKIFKPGINELTLADWEVIKDHDNVKHFLEEGKLSWVGRSPEDKEKPVEMSALPISEVKRIVGNTVDVDLLAKWKTGEKRHEVVKLIEARIAFIVKVPEEKQ